MKRKNKNAVLYLVQAGIIAAAYAALTLAIAPLSYGAVQFRFAEALTVLPIFTPAAVPGLAIGCLIANIVGSPFAIDAVFGTLATLLAAVMTRKTRNILIKGVPVLSTLFPVIFNAVIVGLELCLFSFPAQGSESVFAGFENLSVTAFAVSAGWVALGEIVCCCLIGLPLYAALKKTRVFEKLANRTEAMI